MNSDQLAEELHNAAEHHEAINHVGVELSGNTGLNFVVRGRSIPRSVRDLENEDNIFVSSVSSEHGEAVMAIRTSDTPD